MQVFWLDWMIKNDSSIPLGFPGSRKIFPGKREERKKSGIPGNFSGRNTIRHHPNIFKIATKYDSIELTTNPVAMLYGNIGEFIRKTLFEAISPLHPTSSVLLMSGEVPKLHYYIVFKKYLF